MTATINSVEEYLKSMLIVRSSEDPPKNRGYRWNSVEELLLEQGERHRWKPLPHGIKPMPPRQCFSNALWLLMKRPTRFIYVEGYAHRYIPTHHAWLLDRDGLAVDPTWTGDPELDPGRDYFGIPFKHDWVMARYVSSEPYFGMLHDWWTDYSSMRADPNEFRVRRKEVHG